MKNFKFLLFLFCLHLSISQAQTPFEITPDTPIQFREKTNILVFVDTTNRAQYQDVLKQLDLFVPASQIGPFKTSVTYWIYQRMVNRLDADTYIQIDSSGWKDLTSHIIDGSGNVQTLKSTGFVSPHNSYVSLSLKNTPRSQFTSQFPVFRLKKGEEVAILSKVNLWPISQAKSFSINFMDSPGYSEYRRFSLYAEGILLGILFAFTAFSWFNAAQNKDLTNIFYAIWISSAFLSVFTLQVIDGNRLFEFFIDIESLKTSNSDSYGTIIFFAIANLQSIFYVIFARQFLGIKNHFPRIHALSNFWILVVLTWWVLGVSGYYYSNDPLISASTFGIVYGLGVASMLMALFICSYLRYREGFDIAIFFSYALIPYFIFRTSFLLGVFGFASPFSFLPDEAFGSFLKNQWTNQALGVCFESLIMSLVVVSRSKWLQQELTSSIQKQNELVINQKNILEETVTNRTKELAERTHELAEQNQELDKAHQLVVGSVNYASRLQRGQLPRQERIEERFSSFASIWEPRDTIGGDLYWLSSSQNQGPFVLCVADCTGHGVPGAMLSLLVSNSLERIYANDTSEDPATALISLDHFVRTGLNQDRIDSESDDGCDAAVLRIDRDKQTIEFAGAKLGLFQVSAQGTVTRYLGSRCSLGYQNLVAEADKPVLHKIPYHSGDAFAVVTDGVTDQIGGASGKTSYGYRRLEEILKANCSASADEITAAMKSDFAVWQGTNARRDDVTVVVFRL